MGNLGGSANGEEKSSRLLGKAIFWRWAERGRASGEAWPRQWRSVAAPLAAP